MMIVFYSQYVQLSCIIIREQAAGNILGLCEATLCCYFFAMMYPPLFLSPHHLFTADDDDDGAFPVLSYSFLSLWYCSFNFLAFSSHFYAHKRNHDPLAIIIHSHSTKQSSMKLFPLTDLSTKAFHISPAFLLISVIDSSGYFFLRLGLISCIQSM